MTIKQFVIAQLQPETYYQARFPEWNPRLKNNILCPFHPDKNKPSMALGLRNGGARCHSSSCNASIANVVHFESKLEKITEKQAARRLYREFVRKTLKIKVISKYRSNLQAEPDLEAALKRETGISRDMQREFAIGFDLMSQRFVFPVQDQFGNYVNIRLYTLPSDRRSSTIKMLNLAGYGRSDLYPAQRVKDFVPTKPIYLMASEKEALLAIAGGLQGCCVTAGEGSWDDNWNEFIRPFDLVVVYDRDKAGRDAVDKITERLATVARSVRVAKIPFKSSRKDRKDFADFILKEKGSAKNLKVEEVSKRKDDEPKQPASPELPDFGSDDEQDVSVISGDPKFQDTRIRTRGIVAAKSQISYMVPWKFQVITEEDTQTVSIPFGRVLLDLVGAHDGNIINVLQRIVKGKVESFTVLERIPAMAVEIIPIAVADKDAPYVVQRCYYFGPRIDSNVPYAFHIIPVSAVRSQESMGLITSCVPIAQSIDQFAMSAKIEKRLASVFTPPSDTDAWSWMEQMADRISEQHTRIYMRPDLHMVALLTWCSPIGFRFPNETDITRGWLNALVLGNTETGKSIVCKRLKSVFNCGAFISSENCTFVGLVGGAPKSSSGEHMLRWGRIPLGDRQLVVLEELSGLSIEDISNMSDLRSSGVARLDKGGISAETNARTRLICLSNVRHKDRGVSDYQYGVKAVQELVGHPEDIARFDLILTTVDTEVGAEVINSARFATVATEDEIDVDDLQLLIRFIWSLKPEQIRFSIKAHQQCLDSTLKLAKKYHASIPIFKSGSGRYKLARIAASIACLQFSWKDGYIVVLRDHVHAATRLLETIYNKPSFGYRQYSIMAFDRDSLGNTKVLQEQLDENVEPTKLLAGIANLTHCGAFTVNEFATYFGVHTMNAGKLISEMAAARVITRAERDQWLLTPNGREWLKQIK